MGGIIRLCRGEGGGERRGVMKNVGVQKEWL